MNQRNRLRTGSRIWQSSIARELIRASGQADPRPAMIQRARSLLEDAEVATAPVSFDIIGSLQRIHTIEAVTMREAGRLIPDNKGFRVQVNQAHSISKQRFTTGHEVGHTLVLPSTSRPSLVQDMDTGLFGETSEEEELCDVAASELLLPEKLFRPEATKLGLRLDSVVLLAKMFQASKEASARRLVGLNLWPCALAMWSLAYKKGEAYLVNQPSFDEVTWPTPQPKLRLRYSVRSASFRRFLPSNKSASADGVLNQCFKENRIVCGEERLLLSGREVSLYVMAAPVTFVENGEDRRQVLSLMREVEAVSPTQTPSTSLWSEDE